MVVRLTDAQKKLIAGLQPNNQKLLLEQEGREANEVMDDLIYQVGRKEFYRGRFEAGLREKVSRH